MCKQLLIIASLSFLANLLVGCSVKTYRADRFTIAELGVNTKLKDLIVIVKPNGTRVIMLHGLMQNQSDGTRSISEGAVSALTKLSL